MLERIYMKPYAAPVASCCLPCCAVVMAQSVASLFLLLLMLTNGFSIVVTSIPWYIRWLYWSNPLVRALLLGLLLLLGRLLRAAGRAARWTGAQI